jgi:hypothetical protein
MFRLAGVTVGILLCIGTPPEAGAQASSSGVAPALRPGPPSMTLSVRALELRGFVLDDSTGVDLAAEVWLVAPVSTTDSVYGPKNRVVARVKTDSVGLFGLTAPEPGAYILHARSIGYRAWNRRVVLADSAGTVQVIRMSLGPPLRERIDIP